MVTGVTGAGLMVTGGIGLWENLLNFFSRDNGYHYGRHGHGHGLVRVLSTDPFRCA